MPEVRTVLVAAPELIPALRERLGASDDEVLTFADSETFMALKAIISQRPGLVALERLFAASPRGAALIARIKADPSLDFAQIRILSHDSKYSRVSPRVPRPGGTRAPAEPAHFDAGTRRAPRFRMREGVELIVAGHPAQKGREIPVPAGAFSLKYTYLEAGEQVDVLNVDDVIVTIHTNP